MYIDRYFDLSIKNYTVTCTRGLSSDYVKYYIIKIIINAIYLTDAKHAQYLRLIDVRK